MIARALMAVLGIVGVAGGIYGKGIKSGQIDSIAVLPLDMRSTDPEADYISDGIAESINNSLAQMPDVKVIPYSVALHYKGKAVDIQKTGDELQVQALLTGRVAHHGDNISVGVELDDVRNGKQLWGQQYTGKESLHAPRFIESYQWKPSRSQALLLYVLLPALSLVAISGRFSVRRCQPS